MEYHEIGERFEYDGVMLEVREQEVDKGISCTGCYLSKCGKCIYPTYCYDCVRKDKKYVIYKLVEQCKTKDMEQKTDFIIEGTDKVFATSAINDLKLEDLKSGDFVAFDYNGNTAITRLVSDSGDFMYAVGLWHDSNLVGEKDAIWYADNIYDVNSVKPITNLHYASIEEIKRYVNVITADFELGEKMNRDNEPKPIEECKTMGDYIKSLTNGLRLTLEAKNHDYSNAFSEMYDELGIDYAYGKLREKMNRIKVLRKQPNMVENEGLEDALLDTAGYAILTLVELKKRKGNDKSE